MAVAVDYIIQELRTVVEPPELPALTRVVLPGVGRSDHLESVSLEAKASAAIRRGASAEIVGVLIHVAVDEGYIGEWTAPEIEDDPAVTEDTPDALNKEKGSSAEVETEADEASEPAKDETSD